MSAFRKIPPLTLHLSPRERQEFDQACDARNISATRALHQALRQWLDEPACTPDPPPLSGPLDRP